MAVHVRHALVAVEFDSYHHASEWLERYFHVSVCRGKRGSVSLISAHMFLHKNY